MMSSYKTHCRIKYNQFSRLAVPEYEYLHLVKHVRVIQILYLENTPLADSLNAQLCVNFDLLY